MSDEDAAKKVGLAGAGLAGIFGLLAKLEPALLVGSKAAVVPAAHLAGDGVRLGARALPVAAEGAALGGVVRPTAVMGRGVTPLTMGASRGVSGPGLRALPLAVADDAARATGLTGSLAHHGVPEIVGWTFDAAALVVDDEASADHGMPVQRLPTLAGRTTLVALEDAALPAKAPSVARQSVLRPVQIHGESGLFSVFQTLRHSSPFVIVGRGASATRGEPPRIRVPEGPAIATSAILASCASAGTVCAVVACPAEGSERFVPGCEEASTRAWQAAAAELPAAAYTRDVSGTARAFHERLLTALQADAASRETEVTFLAYDERGSTRLVHAAKAAPPAPPAASSVPTSAVPRVRKPIPRGGSSER